jgi:hypothetical protein
MVNWAITEWYPTNNMSLLATTTLSPDQVTILLKEGE